MVHDGEVDRVRRPWITLRIGALARLGIDETRRAETLSVSEFVALACELS